MPILRSRRFTAGCLLTLILVSSGCHIHEQQLLTDVSGQPHELAKTSLPDYVIEPPDILKIDALYLIPLPPYKVQSLDVLMIRATKTLPEEPVGGLYSVDTDGTVNLGFTYGVVKIAGLSLEEAKKEITTQLLKTLKETQVEVFVSQGRGVQQVRGEHLVRPDGTVSLGNYGSVKVTGLTLQEAKYVIEAKLSAFLQKPEVVVDVLAYNSKVYYVIFDQGGSGQRIFRLPVTGNETVLDAISQVSGLSVVSDEKRMWVSRPSGEDEPDKVLPIDWHAVTARARSETNYQLLPGDRIYVQAYPFVTADTKLARFIAPFERVAGFLLLGSNTAISLRFSPTNGSGGTTTTTR